MSPLAARSLCLQLAAQLAVEGDTAAQVLAEARLFFDFLNERGDVEAPRVTH